MEKEEGSASVSALRMMHRESDKFTAKIITKLQEAIYSPEISPATRLGFTQTLYYAIYYRQRQASIAEIFSADAVAKLRLAFYDAEKYLTAHIKGLSSLFDARFVRILPDASGCNSDVIFDIRRVNLILSHLISNSIMHSKRRDVVIEVKAFTRGDDFVISVTDNGRGIPRDRVKTLFSAYENITNPKLLAKFGNTLEGGGIGLSICRRAAHEMGGELAYIPVPHKTVFELNIPQNQRIDVLAEPAEYIFDPIEARNQMAGALLYLLERENPSQTSV